MVAGLGSAPGGAVGRLLGEKVRTVSFRITAVIRETDLGGDAVSGLLEQLKDLSPVRQRVEVAGEKNEQRERHGFVRTDISSGPPPTLDEILERHRHRPTCLTGGRGRHGGARPADCLADIAFAGHPHGLHATDLKAVGFVDWGRPCVSPIFAPYTTLCPTFTARDSSSKGPGSG